MTTTTTGPPPGTTLPPSSQPVELTDLRIALHRTQDGPELAREPILPSDLDGPLAELWRDHWLRKGHPDMPLHALATQMAVTPVDGSGHRCRQLACTATDPGGQSGSMKLPPETFADVASRLAERLLAAGTLQANDVCHYEIVLQPDGQPPQAPAGPTLSATAKHTPLCYLRIPIEQLRSTAETVGTLDPQAFPVFFTTDALATSRRLAHRGVAHRPAIETGGVLIGVLCSCPETGEFYAVVCDVVEAKDADGSTFSLAYTGKTWARIQAVVRAMQSRPETRTQRLLGQVHGHNMMPGNACHACPKVTECKLSSVFVSADDRRWSRAVFQHQPWHICQVFGFNARGEYVHALFTQQGNQLRERGFYVIPSFAGAAGDTSLPTTQPLEQEHDA